MKILYWILYKLFKLKCKHEKMEEVSFDPGTGFYTLKCIKCGMIGLAHRIKTENDTFMLEWDDGTLVKIISKTKNNKNKENNER